VTDKNISEDIDSTLITNKKILNILDGMKRIYSDDSFYQLLGYW
jgi:hypothetical protein